MKLTRGKIVIGTIVALAVALLVALFHGSGENSMRNVPGVERPARNS